MKRLFIFGVLTMAVACSSDNNGTNNGGTPDTGSNNGVADVGNNGIVDTGPDAEDTGPDVPPRPDGVSIPGLSGDLKVEYDENGVLHIDAKTDEDLIAAQGYYHASNRFAQMDLNRRIGRGRVSEVVGDIAINFDISMRTILSTQQGQPLAESLWEGTAPENKVLFEAYARGVNAWLEDWRDGRNGAVMSEEYDHPIINTDAITPWEPEDSIANALLLLDDLSNSSGTDLFYGETYASLTPDQAFDIAGMMSATGYSTMSASGETYSRALTQFPDATQLGSQIERLKGARDVIAQARERLDAVYKFRGINPNDLDGSNNWVLGPTKTQSGMPILANDPHLGLSNPALWFLVEMDAKTNGTGELHIAGASLPGLPGILLGHNEDIAWGGTVVFFDLADVYLETLTADGNSVMFNGNPVAIVEVEHEFIVDKLANRTETIRVVPHHGPLLSYDPATNSAVSLRWRGADAKTDADMFFGLARATTVAEAREAIKSSSSTNQNWIVADKEGNIGWFPFNDVPERPWASLALPPWTPLPGDGSAEWGATIPKDDLPQMLNPTNDFIATANTDPVGTLVDGDPTNDAYGYMHVGGEFAGFRQQAVVDGLNAVADGMHTAESSRKLQGDDYMVLKDYVATPLEAIIVAPLVQLTPAGQVFWGAITGWNGTCPTGLATSDQAGAKDPDLTNATESIGCAAMHYLLATLSEDTFGDELEGTPMSPLGLSGLRTLVVLLNRPADLQGGAVYWDNTATDGPPETDIMISIAAVERAATRIAADMGSATPDDWRWGKLHGLTMGANVLGDAGLVQFNEGPFAAPGGWFAVNVANPSRAGRDGDWNFGHGPSMRHVSEFTATGIKSFWTLPGGQTHRRDHPTYLSLLEDWLKVDHFEMLFTRADVTAGAVEGITVVPR